MTRTGPRLGPALDSSKAKVSAQCERRALDSGPREHLQPAFAAFISAFIIAQVTAANGTVQRREAADNKTIQAAAAQTAESDARPDARSRDLQHSWRC